MAISKGQCSLRRFSLQISKTSNKDDLEYYALLLDWKLVKMTEDWSDVVSRFLSSESPSCDP